MKYDFDQVINRKNTASMKWDGAYTFFGDQAEGALPMWVADMDFRCADEIITALKKRAEEGIFGYPMLTESYYDAVIGWMKRHYDWQVKKEWIQFSPGIVSALNYIVQAFTAAGDSILIQSPVYYPFTNAIVNNHRRLVRNDMIETDHQYTIDFADFEKKIVQESVKMYILCNPHNPGGRVWTEQELKQLCQICKKHNVLLVSDEIHADLTYSGYKTTAVGRIAQGVYDRVIVCTAASKTFNLAGLQTSNIMIADESLRNTFADYMDKLHLIRPNIFGQTATEAAYTYGDEWLLQLRAYLEDNLNFMMDFIAAHVPEIKVMKPQATYLVFLDCKSLGLGNQELRSFMLQKAKVAMDDGFVFGPGGEGYVRINIACPRALLEDALKRIEKAVKNR